MTLIEKLSKIFDRLDASIGYLSPNSKGRYWSYKQQSKVIILGDVYYDFDKPHFITPSTILNNREVLFKLNTYENECNINFIPEENGFRVMVYNKLGLLIYKNYILFYDKWINFPIPINYIVNKILYKRYPELTI